MRRICKGIEDPITKKCLTCQKVFSKRETCSLSVWNTKRYCSKLCWYSSAERRKQYTKKHVSKRCLCGKTFGITEHDAERKKYCSPECQHLDQQRRTELSCKVCGKHFIVRNKFLKPSKSHPARQYCSKSCQCTDNLGKQSKTPHYTLSCKTCGKSFTVNESRKNKAKYCSVICRINRVLTERESMNHSLATVRTMQTKNYKYKGFFYSAKNNKMFGYRSSWELIAMRFFETMSSVLKYEYEVLSIPYLDKKGKLRRTIPDFVVYYTDGQKQIIEVKPLFMIKKDLQNTRRKLAATEKFAKKNGMTYAVWTERELHIK